MNIIEPDQGITAYEKNAVTVKKLLSKSVVEVVRVELAPRSSLVVSPASEADGSSTARMVH